MIAHRETTTAAAALYEVGQQIGWAVAFVQRIVFLVVDALLLFDFVPEGLIDDTQVRHLRDHPLVFGVEARNAFTSLRVLDVAQPVPDLATDIEFIVQDACAALAIAIDGAWAPCTAIGRANALCVEGLGKGGWGGAIGIGFEDALDGLSLQLIDFAAAAFDHTVGASLVGDVIAIDNAASALAFEGTALQPTASFIGEFFEEHRAHCAAEPNVQLVYETLRQGEYLLVIEA